MNTEIQVHVTVSVDSEGYHVAKSKDYKGIVSFGKTAEEAIDRYISAWSAVSRARTIMNNKSQFSISASTYGATSNLERSYNLSVAV